MLSGASNFANPVAAFAATLYALNEFDDEAKADFISDILIVPEAGSGIIYFFLIRLFLFLTPLFLLITMELFFHIESLNSFRQI